MDESALSDISSTVTATTKQDTGKDEHFILPIGIYGWRKRFIYCFILLLVVMVLVNLSLTIWILVVMNFNINGMGALTVTSEGISITGTAEFLETVYAMSIIADQDSSLEIRSGRDINIASEHAGLYLGPDEIQVVTDSLQVQSNSGGISSTLLSVSDDQLSISASAAVLGESSKGLFVGHVQGVSQIDSSSSAQLQIAAPTGSLSLAAMSSLVLEAGGGPVDIVADTSLTLNSTAGLVSLTASTIKFETLPLSLAMSEGQTWPGVYHLCSCPSGKLFRVPANNTQGCVASQDLCAD